MRTLALLPLALLAGCSAGEAQQHKDATPPAEPQQAAAPAQIVSVGPDQPVDGITTRAEATRAAHSQQPVPIGVADGADRRTVLGRARKALRIGDEECGEAAGYLAALRNAELMRGSAAGTARIAREVWTGRLRDQQTTIIWKLAYAATCYDGRALHVIRILDENAREIRRQPVSLDPQCRGDGMFPPDTPWYRC